MWSKPRPACFSYALCALLLMALLSPPAFAARAIVNQSRPDNEIINRADLRAIFTLRKRQWSSGAPVKVYVLPDQHPVHEGFVKEKLLLYPYQLRQIWNRLVFSGTGVAPVQVDSEAELLDAVANNPDAIGYVNAVELPDTVKVVPQPLADETEVAVEAGPAEETAP